MTTMGMAASQARFLGLTARKSNVEYQGQQVNQQRTALANESANLYNQMMELSVPTPPSTSDYYKATYVLEDSAGSYAKENYKIANVTKTYNAENEYTVTLTAKREYIAPDNISYIVGALQVVPKADEDGVEHDTYKISLHDTKKDSAEQKTVGLYYDPENTNAYTGKNGSLSISQYQIYAVDTTKSLDGANECCTDKDTNYFFYQDKNGKNHFLTEEQVEALTKPETTNELIDIARTYSYTKEESTQVVGILETASSGRYSSIRINEDESYSNELSGREFAISTVQEYDKEAYDNAFNDYEYNKALYEKSISDINAQTEVIQSQDQQLELRLNQLDTEQNAIQTEIDSVTNVIEKNIEKTFTIFG